MKILVLNISGQNPEVDRFLSELRTRIPEVEIQTHESQPGEIHVLWNIQEYLDQGIKFFLLPYTKEGVSNAWIEVIGCQRQGRPVKLLPVMFEGGEAPAGLAAAKYVRMDGGTTDVEREWNLFARGLRK